jgi:hypothetical protein
LSSPVYIAADASPCPYQRFSQVIIHLALRIGAEQRREWRADAKMRRIARDRPMSSASVGIEDVHMRRFRAAGKAVIEKAEQHLTHNPSLAESVSHGLMLVNDSFSNDYASLRTTKRFLTADGSQ